MVLKIGLVGCGAIGTEIAMAIDRGDIGAELVAVFDRNEDRAGELIKCLKAQPMLSDLEDLVERSEIVVEAASQRAVMEVAKATLERGRDLMIMSVGALLDRYVYRMVENLARENGCRVNMLNKALRSARMIHV